jgi:S1-C subfamily serine protease
VKAAERLAFVDDAPEPSYAILEDIGLHIDLNPELVERNSAAVTIIDILPHTPGERSGLLIGDVIETINGQSIGTIGDAVKALTASDPAEGKFSVQALREGRSVERLIIVERKSDSPTSDGRPALPEEEPS